jgi:hypothetical protein
MKGKQKFKKSAIDLSLLADLLKIPQIHDPSAHIAGGYLRDCLLGRAPKDVDIFVHYGALKAINRDFVNQGFDITRVISPDRFRSNPEVCYTADLKSPEGTIINLTGISRPMTMMENLERFDFGVCRVGFDGSKLVRHPNFDRDTKAEEFVLRRCDNKEQFFRSLSRAGRLSVKYPGWELVIPPKFLKVIATELGAAKPDRSVAGIQWRI